MKNSEIKELTLKEIVEKLDVEKSMLTKLKLNHAVSPLDNPLKIKDTNDLPEPIPPVKPTLIIFLH